MFWRGGYLRQLRTRYDLCMLRMLRDQVCASYFKIFRKAVLQAKFQLENQPRVLVLTSPTRLNLSVEDHRIPSVERGLTFGNVKGE